MMKRLVFVIISISAFFITFLLHANADEIYYTNDNNVSMTEEQYNFLGEMYYDGFQEIITQELFNKYLTYGYFNGTIEKYDYEDDNVIAAREEQLRGTVHETTAKKLSISKACGNTFCAISVALNWKATPNIKSYDVIGALLYNNVSLLNNDVFTYLQYSGGTLYYSDEYYVGGGFGTSVKLQNSSTLMRIGQSFDVYGTGTVYASYQHATQNITKATSQKYTVGFGGYGGVFHFYGSAVGVFDQMGGVNIYVNV